MSENNSDFFYMTRRIGSTVYKVKVHLAEEGTGSAEDKILRIIDKELLTAEEKCGIVSMPQTSRQSERSA